MTCAMGTQKHAAVAVEQSANTATADAAELDDAGDVSLAERRRAHRLIVDLEVDYQCEDNYLFAYICDISSTGIFVRTTAPHPPGTRLNLRFAPPAQAAVTARMRAPTATGTTLAAPSRPSASVLAHTIDDEDEDDLLSDAAQTVDLLDANDDDADELHDPWSLKHASNSNEPVRRPSTTVIDLSPIEVEGEVIWTNPYRPNDKDNTHPGMGIRFSPLDDLTRQRLLELIRRIAYLPEL
jgi:hypothetical protein